MFNFFDKNKEPKDIKEILKQFKDLEKKMESFSKELDELKQKNRFSIQKIGIIRFNPFSNVGGDQSFSVALLDKNNNGIVISSLFSQEGNRVYGKSVEKGTSQYTLSEEEKKAIEKAIENKNPKL